MEAIHPTSLVHTKPTLFIRVLCATFVLLIMGGIGLAHPDLSGEDSDHYRDLMLNHWSVVPQPFSSRFLHAEVVSLLIRGGGLPLHTAAMLVACFALLLTVAGISLIFARLQLDPLILVFALSSLAFVQTFQLIYMPDLFYTMLIVTFLLLLISEQLLLAAFMVFVLFCARESTMVLGVVLIGLSVESWRSARKEPQLKSKTAAILAAFFLATIIGFGFNRYVTSKSAGNIHHISGLVYLVGKAPFNFLKNVLGIEPWTNTLTATEGNHPIYKHAVPHGLHLGEIHEIGIAEMSIRYPLGWLTNSLCMFGVLLTVVCRQVVVNITLARSEMAGRVGGFRSILLGIKQTVLEQPFFSQVALLYGLISFAIVPVLGTAVHRYIYYSWPAFWITGVLILQRQYLDRPSPLASNDRIGLLIAHLMMAGISFLITWYSGHWAPMLAFFVIAIFLQCTAWFYLSKLTPKQDST